jgi:hypothetical protein
VHQYTSMTYKMKNTYRYEVALLLLHVACCTYMVQPEKCYTTHYLMCMHAQTPLCSAGPGSETMVLLYYSIFYVHACTNLYAQQDLDLKQWYYCTTQYFMCMRKPLCSAGPGSETMHY